MKYVQLKPKPTMKKMIILRKQANNIYSFNFEMVSRRLKK